MRYSRKDHDHGRRDVAGLRCGGRTAELTFLQLDDRIIAQKRDCFRPMQYGQANLFVVLTEQACASRLAASPVTESLTLKATQALR